MSSARKFKVKAKQLALCIMGRRYLGVLTGKARKRRASDGDAGPST